ncbi:hypothetical protein JTB14_014744 [Gonioctena quinquepunctata]|nr:hypothetical protein JTB14_014744 [Gonioctena quinquepunctata]
MASVLRCSETTGSECLVFSDHASNDDDGGDFRENTSETEENVQVNREEEKDAEPTVVEIQYGRGLCPKYIAKSGMEWESQPLPSTSKRRSGNMVGVRPGITRYSESASSILDFFNPFITVEMKDITCLHTNEEASRFYDNWYNNHPDKETNCAERNQQKKCCLPILQFGGRSSLLPCHETDLRRNLYSYVLMMNRQELNANIRDELAMIRELWDMFVDNCRKAFEP